jgi:sulfur carrier protein ThiS
MTSVTDTAAEERSFLELRRKVQGQELLSASVEKLLQALRFTGRLSIVVQNGRVLKSGYEEGYFSRRAQARLLEKSEAPCYGLDPSE